MPEETKPQVAKEGEGDEVKPKINLTFMFNDQSIRLQMKMNTPFKKAFNTAYERFNQNPKTVRFMYEGTRIREPDTPADYDMEDGDQVDVQVEQLGGRRAT